MMRVKRKTITIAELVNGYINNDEEGVVAYGGKLDVRPKYQRNWIYERLQEEAVIKTISQKRPLNNFYWAVRDDGTYEVLDGQQRTISICRYYKDKFQFDYRANGNPDIFFNYSRTVQNHFLGYKIEVYLCSGGSYEEKMEWFETINIAGKELTKQELRNAVYAGPWVSAAKKDFSMTGCQGENIGSPYLAGSRNRQEYLEAAIEWKAGNGDKKIKAYMSKNKKKQNADELFDYFSDVVDWIQEVFTKTRPQMKGLDWGTFYRNHKNDKFNPEVIEDKIHHILSLPKAVGVKKSGVYEYILTGDEQALIDRLFSREVKQGTYERQKEKCKECNKRFEYDEMEGDHIKPWIDGGTTDDFNCQMLCIDCHKKKTAKQMKEMRGRWKTHRSMKGAK